MTSMNRRGFLGVTLGAAAIAGLAGCQPSASGPTSAAPTSTGPSAAPGGGYKMDLGGYIGPELTTEPITLRIMRQNWSEAADKSFDSNVAAFTKAYPNITVKQEYVPYGDLGEKLRTTFAAGSAADIVMGQTALVSSYVFGEMVVPVGDYLSEEFKADYVAALKPGITVDDHMWAMPSFFNTQGICYSKDIFAEAGIETPPESEDINDGWSLEQWFETWARLRSWLDSSGKKDMFPIDASGYGNGGPGSNYQQLEQTWIRMMGSPEAPKDTDEYKVWAGISDDGKTVQGYVNNPLAIEGAKNYRRIFEERWSPTSNQSTMFAAGQAASKWGAFPDPSVSFPQGVTALPRGKIVATSNASDAFVVTSQTKYPAEACALLAAVQTVQAQLDWAVAWANGVPVMESVIAKLPAEMNSVVMQANIGFARASHPMPATPAWFEYANQMNISLRDIALGADPADALNKAAEAIDQQIAKYH